MQAELQVAEYSGISGIARWSAPDGSMRLCLQAQQLNFAVEDCSLLPLMMLYRAVAALIAVQLGLGGLWKPDSDGIAVP